MKKIFGVEAEFNITADEDIVRGIGKGVAKGSVSVEEIIKELKPAIVSGIKNLIDQNEK